tara:strand:- start:1942 stop:2361 length:420 start_codon:yes stop_codon:yes gene_type:complete
MNWSCQHTWKKASINTLWCLLGCSIGDFGTIFIFQNIEHYFLTWQVMTFAIINGLLTSVILETIILSNQMLLKEAFRVAIGMSFISMLAMELAMNIIDVWLTGGAKLTWWVVPIMLFVGFITALPYNYYRLKKWGHGCH